MASLSELFALRTFDVLRCQSCGALVHNRDGALHVTWHAGLPIPAWHTTVAYPAEVTLVPLNTADPNDLSVSS